MNTNENHISEPHLVVIGGGTGISSVLRGLKNQPCRVTAIVTMFDSGGSSGLLREEFGYPPFGDLRQCLLALSEEESATEVLQRLFEFRFSKGSSLDGHSLGNLLLAALTTLRQDVQSAIREVSQLLHVKGQVVPVSLEMADLCAELEDGTVIRGEAKVDLRPESWPGIQRVFLEPDVTANPKAVEAIKEADAIVLGPGDLYTSIVPNLLVKGISEAIAETQAVRVYICNLMTKRSETDGFAASDFVREMTHYLKGPSLDWVVVNDSNIQPSVKKAYEAQGARPVDPDIKALRTSMINVALCKLGSDEGVPLRHDPARTTAAIFRLIEAGRISNWSDPVVSLTSLSFAHRLHNKAQ